MSRKRHTGVLETAALACVALGLVIWARSSVAGQGVREITVDGDQFAYSPRRIEVQKDDLVKVTFTAKDIPHSIAIDSYRIVKRAGAGQTVVFEFRADREGSHTFYCNLSQDDRCRQMKGELVVR
jgi:heme/copper-type cytochrome/quinol oxidase subunit 2